MTCICNLQRKCLCICPLAMLLMLSIAKKKKYCSLLKKISPISNQAHPGEAGSGAAVPGFLPPTPQPLPTRRPWAGVTLFVLPLTPFLPDLACPCPFTHRSSWSSASSSLRLWSELSLAQFISVFPWKHLEWGCFRCGGKKKRIKKKTASWSNFGEIYKGTSCPPAKTDCLSVYNPRAYYVDGVFVFLWLIKSC